MLRSRKIVKSWPKLLESYFAIPLRQFIHRPYQLSNKLTVDSFIALPYFGLLSLGTVFFALTFILHDCIHMRGGRDFAYCTLATTWISQIALVLLGVPLRFLLADLIAMLVADIANTEVFHSLIRRSWAVKVITSNAVSVALDSAVFTLVALTGLLSVYSTSQIMYADVL